MNYSDTKKGAEQFMKSSKCWYKSKTIWANVLIGAVAGISAVVSDGEIDADTARILTLTGAMSNLFLRFVTDKPIEIGR